MRTLYTIPVVVVSLVASLAACGDEPGLPGSDAGDVSADVGDVYVYDTGGDAGGDAGVWPDVGDVGSTDKDTDPSEDATAQGFPSEISTEGGSWEARVSAGAQKDITLVAQKNDVVIIRLSAVGPYGTPGLELYRDDERLVYSTPEEGDAHIPYRDEDLAEGWVFLEGGQHRLAVSNTAAADARLKLTVECLEGPCRDEDDPGEDPSFEGLSDDALEQALRTDHQTHRSVSYERAREAMFSVIDNMGGTVEGVYTGATIQTMGVPDHTVFNTEHTWPRSKGAGSGDAEADLHHLFPTDSRANSRRGNLRFGVVTGTVEWSDGGSMVGPAMNGDQVFEVRPKHRGNTARAMFYFAVIYSDDIPSDEEAVLRRWHTQDPVNSAEQQRNTAVENVQQSRNRFIGQPDLVPRISDF
jgi:endonuclease I